MRLVINRGGRDERLLRKLSQLLFALGASRIDESLPVELKSFQFYIVHSNLIERIFHLILNIEKGD